MSQHRAHEFRAPISRNNRPFESNKLKHRFIGPFAVLARHGAAYTIDLPKSMATHPTFYVRRLKRYQDPLGLPSRRAEAQGEVRSCLAE
ncbi:Pol protein [Phytophthora palmivora]|uniref:Pol protein n=1 Tax=Phytophthora palmivora TaxID=4796 RepID=A0A2P4YQ78_9STRA|nr:Pol protein [Phytophthora palmivora]